ncbi:SprT family zinc-dependent metalloprotease [Hathewaya histolytica]|uniref:Putative metal-dependent hydrolase n=1 Tax=Hathewaya histolytica TaxID=1498 RepID=A0A4U9QX58_HATHI|nr:SprT family zinc-dependent metalloprotease [Hathewaya histolytica]VTQ83356.1 putative metal-dependent hydrolase [Hathewaya histolytica]
MEFYFVYENGQAKVKVDFKNRKSIKISVEDDKTINVISPLFLEEEKVREVIENKRVWIEKHLRFYKEKLSGYIQRDYKSGDKFLYFGDEYSLVVDKNPKLIKVTSDYNEKKLYVISPRVDKENIKELLYKFYREETAKEVRRAINKFQIYFPMKPTEVVIKDQKRRWGSCTYKNKILLNFRLSMATRGVLEYVVLHEMCHMVHKNHSKDFWNLVHYIMPDYKEKSIWLKENGAKIEV